MELITVGITVKAVTFFENVSNSIIKPAPIHTPLAYNSRHDSNDHYHHQKNSKECTAQRKILMI